MALAVLFGKTEMVAIGMAGGTVVLFKVGATVAVTPAVPFNGCGRDRVVRADVLREPGSPDVTWSDCCKGGQLSCSSRGGQPTVTVVYTAAAVVVNVVTIVDGVTRQLQALLRRRDGYAPASGGPGESCLLRSGGTIKEVAFKEVPVAWTRVALL